MSLEALEERLAAVETKLRQIEQAKEQVSAPNAPESVIPWWERIRGQFKDDPHYLEAMRLGREWRDAENATDREKL